MRENLRRLMWAATPWALGMVVLVLWYLARLPYGLVDFAMARVAPARHCRPART